MRYDSTCTFRRDLLSAFAVSRLQTGLRVQGWNDLPTEVLHMVLNKSSEEFCWHLRGVASSWAVAIRSFTKAQLVISAEQDTDHWAGVRQLFQFVQQRAHQYPNACLIIQPRPLVPTACVKFLQGLAEQVRISNQGHLHQFPVC